MGRFRRASPGDLSKSQEPRYLKSLRASCAELNKALPSGAQVRPGAKDDRAQPAIRYRSPTRRLALSPRHISLPPHLPLTSAIARPSIDRSQPKPLLQNLKDSISS
jgi:hypothetical protein